VEGLEYPISRQNFKGRIHRLDTFTKAALNPGAHLVLAQQRLRNWLARTSAVIKNANPFRKRANGAILTHLVIFTGTNLLLT
jgi:hypothetical protein